MNLTAIVLLASCLQISALGNSQGITLNVRNAPLNKVFHEIKKQTGYTFMYTETMLKESKRVSIDIENSTLQEALALCFASQPFTYRIINKTVVVQPKEMSVTNTDNSTSLPPPPVEIRGRVVNQQGAPLPNVSVLIVGTNAGTATNSEGRFTLTAPDDKNILLEISSVGYQTKKVDVGKQTEINVMLELDVSGLNDIVVIGYGSVKRKDLTGSVATVKSADMVKSTDMSLNGTLQGRAAGVSVISNEGQPGADVSIYIRAGSSISASNDPLYVIDGFPQLGGSNLNINVNDVESVEILKDASATAIYGSRGANGVVIITTKSGKTGKFSVNYDGYYSLQQLGVKKKVLNTLQYAELQHFLRSNPHNSGIGDSLWYNWPTYADSININWQDEVYRLAGMFSHNLSFTGGTANLKAAGSLNFTDQDGIAVGTNYKRYSARLNTTSTISKIITNSTNIALTYQDRTGSSLTGSGGLAYSAIKGSPFKPPTFNLNQYLIENGVPAGGVSGKDPLVDLLEPTVKNLNYFASFNSSFSIKLLEGLTLKIAGGVNYTNVASDYFYGANTSAGANVLGAARKNNNVNIGLLNENTLNYSKFFGAASKLDAVLGFSFQRFTSTFTNVGTSHFAIEALGYDNLSFGSQFSAPASGKLVSGLVSYFGRAQYAFNDKYILTGTIRADGSSKFPIHKWGYFPSGGLAWRIDNENFMHNAASVSTLKMRLSYGLTGNESIAPYSTYTTYDATPQPSVQNDQIVVGVAPAQLGSDELKWESTIQKNLGIDLGLFNDRILLTADVYIKNSKDLLLRAPLSNYSGFSTVTRNVGDIQVKGMEFSLNTANLKGKFNWNTNFNISFSRSKVLKLNDNEKFFYTATVGRFANAYIVDVGKPLGSMFGYVTDGIINTQEELATAPRYNSLKVSVGARKYVDISGPNGKPDGVIDVNDRVVVGNGNPKFFGGFTNDFSYGSFDFSFLFTYSYGNDILNGNKALLDQPTIYRGGTLDILDRWTPENPQINKQGWSAAVNEFDYLSDYVVEDGSYLRLKNVQLAYNIKPDLLKKLPIKSLRVYATAQNLLTFTHYTGYDPEVNYFGSLITPGADLGAYPRSKIYTLGVNIAF